MSWVTAIWSMVAAACLTLASVHLLVWWFRRSQLGNLLFVFTSLATAFYAACELWMMHALEPVEIALAIRWLQVAAWCLIIGLVAFVRVYLRAGRPWLGWSICGLRSLSLLLNFTVGENLNFLQITSVARIPFLGELVSSPIGIRNPCMLVGQLALLLLLLFVADAAITVWRRGEPRLAVVVGGGIFFCVFGGSLHAILALWFFSPTVIFGSLYYVTLIGAMNFELSREVLQAGKISAELKARRAELNHLSRVAMLGELSGSLAHELNQPLTAILSSAQAAQRHLARPEIDRAELEDILKDIVEADLHASSVISGLRTLLRKETEARSLLDMNEVVNEVLKLMRTDFRRQNIQVKTTLQPDLPAIHGERVQLQQVLLNLLLNACDAMAEPQADRRIEVITESLPGDRVRVSVRDYGRGIPQSDLERIFDPFITSKPNGLGLGLSVCRSIVQAHHGTLIATSSPGEGTILELELGGNGKL